MDVLCSMFISILGYINSKGAGAKCDHQRIGVRARVRANLNLDVRGACMQCKKQSQLTPCKKLETYFAHLYFWTFAQCVP